MYDETFDYYDLIYGQFKDYTAEARKIAELLAVARPGARTVLDVACGSGEHARLLHKNHGLVVDGIDLEPGFVALAAEKNPDGRFQQADMRDFALNRRYDVVMCLFSAIGYVKTLENVIRTLRCFKAHLTDGGVILVEPWMTPEVVKGKYMTLKTVESDDVMICRMSRTEVEGRLSRIHFAYLIGTADGIHQASETHELGLFTAAEMHDCFAAAGLSVDYDPEGIYGRGLYLARRQGLK